MAIIPLVINDVPLEGYFIDNKDGTVYSGKQNKFKKMYFNVSGQSKYPKYNFSIDGKTKSIPCHKAVASALIPIPIPNGVTESEWKVTPRSVKNLLLKSLHVNHIDHDVMNFHVKNLEWVTGQENNRKYAEHRVSKAKTRFVTNGLDELFGI